MKLVGTCLFTNTAYIVHEEYYIFKPEAIKISNIFKSNPKKFNEFNELILSLSINQHVTTPTLSIQKLINSLLATFNFFKSKDDQVMSLNINFYKTIIYDDINTFIYFSEYINFMIFEIEYEIHSTNIIIQWLYEYNINTSNLLLNESLSTSQDIFLIFSKLINLFKSIIFKDANKDTELILLELNFLFRNYELPINNAWLNTLCFLVGHFISYLTSVDIKDKTNNIYIEYASFLQNIIKNTQYSEDKMDSKMVLSEDLNVNKYPYFFFPENTETHCETNKDTTNNKYDLFKNNSHFDDNILNIYYNLIEFSKLLVLFNLNTSCSIYYTNDNNSLNLLFDPVNVSTIILNYVKSRLSIYNTTHDIHVEVSPQSFEFINPNIDIKMDDSYYLHTISCYDTYTYVFILIDYKK